MNSAATANNLDLSTFAGHGFAVLGLGVSGLSSATALKNAGAHVLTWDDNEDRRTKAAGLGLATAESAEADLSGVDTLVLSPGIPHGHPHSHPMIDRARAAGYEIVCDLELLTRAAPDARYLGITGTNGKSTTTALIAHILSEIGAANAMGGNIGAPGLGLPALDATGTYVLELSSYQLELLPTAIFDVAILLNITPDHLDRHGGMDGYVAAKQRIFDGQAAGQTAIVGIDDDPSKAIFDTLKASSDAAIVPISTRATCAGGVYVQNGWLVDDRNGSAIQVLELAGLETLAGTHNVQNVAAAFAASSVIAGPENHDAIVTAIGTFPGLAHRQELVGYRGTVRFINDSKATNAEAAAHALSAYDNIYWILGGVAKDGGITSLVPLFERVRHAFLIGEAADSFDETLQGRIPTEISGDLAAAVTDAARLASHDGQSRATILLSPACASFDQFDSFEARGDAFRARVQALDGFTPQRAGGTA